MSIRENLMEDREIKQVFLSSIEKLKSDDSWLLTNDLSEQSISHKIAEHLQHQLAGTSFKVDCEYNGDVDNGNSKKRIMILREMLEMLNLLKPREAILEAEILERAVFPDIIVHHRGDNDHNLLIIEVKKASSKVPFDYDALKLIAYTTSDYGNHLRYKLGAFIVIDNNGHCDVEYYKDGKKFQFE